MADMQGLVLAGLSPHPPIIVPEVGREGAGPAAKTAAAVRRLAAEVVATRPETVVIVGPHGPVRRDAFLALAAPWLEGDFGSFGAPQVSLRWRTDQRLLREVIRTAAERRIRVLPLGGDREPPPGGRAAHAMEIDYATLVPLYFLRAAGYEGQVLIISMAYTSYETCHAFGRAVAQAARAAQEPVVFLASGDLSHRLKPGAPAGYDPQGAVFDQAVVDALARADAGGLLCLDQELIERAGECGLRPVLILLGAVAEAGLVPEVLSYEGPFGVGYGVAAFRPPAAGAEPPSVGAGKGGHPLVRLARSAIEAYVRDSRIIEPGRDEATGQGLPARAGAFVSIHASGGLRGCIGTIGPTRPSLAQEIVHNAIAAATEDSRFKPIAPAELPGLVISVDVLGVPEPVSSLEDLDPKSFGVIVERGARRGLLLPDLKGVDTAAQQYAIACRKAGLRSGEAGIRISRFRVERFH